jgi:hypothetical protein
MAEIDPDNFSDDDICEGTDDLAKAIIDSMCEEANTLQPGGATTALLLEAGYNQIARALETIDGLSEEVVASIAVPAMRSVVVLGGVAGIAAQMINTLKGLGVEPKFPDRLEPPDFPPSE